MSFDIASLTSRELTWDTAGVWLAVAVAVGVAMESVADFDAIATWFRLDSLEGSRRQKNISKIGLLILIVALAGEVVAAMQSHDISEQIIAGLNNEVTETQGRERDLIDLTSGLKQQLSAQRKTLDTIGDRSTDFERIAKEQRARDDAALMLLKGDEENLKQAQSDADRSAGIAANAADSAHKAAAEMTATLDAEQAMRQQMHDIVTPRQIDDAHFAALVDALKAFERTAIEVAVSREGDSPDLLVRITDALTQANWTIKPWSGGGFPLTESTRPNLPGIGDVTARGIQITILESDRGKLGAAVRALADGLFDAGINVAPPQVIPDKTANGKPDPFRVKPGIIRIVVGTK